MINAISSSLPVTLFAANTVLAFTTARHLKRKWKKELCLDTPLQITLMTFIHVRSHSHVLIAPHPPWKSCTWFYFKQQPNKTYLITILSFGSVFVALTRRAARTACSNQPQSVKPFKLKCKSWVGLFCFVEFIWIGLKTKQKRGKPFCFFVMSGKMDWNQL